MTSKSSSPGVDSGDFLKRIPGLLGANTPDGRFVNLSPYWSDVLGYRLEELEGARFINFVHPDDQGVTQQVLSRLLDGEEVNGFFNRYRHADGHYIYIQWYSRLDKNGLIYFSANDITGRVKTEDQLRSSSQRLNDVAKTASIGGWEVDIEKGIVFWDDQTCLIHEVEPGTIPDLETAIDYYAPEAREMVAEMVDRGIELGEGWEIEAPLITAKGNRIWVRAVGHAIYRDERPIRLTGIFQNITEVKLRQLAEMQLREQAENLREKADEASRSKSAFLANMSHEIRTPLNGMMGMTQLLRREALSGKQKMFVDTLESSGRALQAIIDDILDISRIEAGQMELTTEDFNLSDMLNTVRGVVIADAEKKKIGLKCTILDEVELARHGDSKHIQQVLINLVGNAVKFTKEGSVQVFVSEPTEDRIRFEIFDTGPGVAAENQKIIFDRFAQADQSAHRAFDGTGLGLAICKELVDLAGGDIGVVSQEGQGSLFWFEWPLPVSADSTHEGVDSFKAAELHQERGEGRILIAEDKPVNFMVLREALRGAGFEVLHANTGAEAVEMNAIYHPDLIMMDLHMPVMSGDEAISEIRSSDGHNPPIVAVTADATSQSRDSIERLGVDGIFIKPYRLDEIVKHTRDIIETASSRGVTVQRERKAI
jgi:PAS domain S-box-containing protein